MRARCARCGEGSVDDPDVPDSMCWDRTAMESQVQLWLRKAAEDPYGEARHRVMAVMDERAVPVLREYLQANAAADPLVVQAAIYALGGSGRSADGLLLVPLLDHPDAEVRAAARGSLTELDTRGAADLLADQLVRPDRQFDRREPIDEPRQILDCLVWLRDERARPALLALARGGDVEGAHACRFSVADALVRLGHPEDRTLLAHVTERVVRDAAAAGVGMRDASAAWWHYNHAVSSVAPSEVQGLWARLQDLGESVLQSVHWERRALPHRDPFTDRVVPRMTLVDLDGSDVAFDGPFAVFGGQPEWRESPAWPVGGDGQLLLFYGQIPLQDGRTAYLFTAGPDEWQPLGPGSAVVVQPGGACHLPTQAVERGPQLYMWQDSHERRYRSHRTRTPAPAVRFALQPGLDPEQWTLPTLDEGQYAEPEGDWNKLGGTPRWLQHEQMPPGDGWQYAFQFTAAKVGSERGDGAECYGWLRADGTGAFGWQSH